VVVREALGFHVAGLIEEPFDEALAPPECGSGLPHGGVEQVGNLFQGVGDLEPAPAATEGGLDRDGKSVFLREGLDFFCASNRIRSAGDEGRPGPARDVAGAHFVAERIDRRGWRADPREAGADDGAGEVGVLREEPIPRVNGIRPRPAGDVENLCRIEIGFSGAGAAEREGLVNEFGVQGGAVGIGVDPDGSDPRIRTCARDPDGNLAPVGDENLAQRASPGSGHALYIYDLIEFRAFLQLLYY